MNSEELSILEIVLRLTLSVIIGGGIGLERERKNRPAGMRTYMLVSLSSCLIMLTNIYLCSQFQTGDPARLGAQAVTGVGFLGTGTIILTKRNQIKGLTTAAGLWSAAAIGLAVGTGFYVATITSALLILFILSFFHQFDMKLHNASRYFEIFVELDSTSRLPEIVKSTRELFPDKLEDMYVNFDYPTDAPGSYILSIKTLEKQDHSIVCDHIKACEGVIIAEII